MFVEILSMLRLDVHATSFDPLNSSSRASPNRCRFNPLALPARNRASSRGIYE
jgi:hypothetical protein